MKPVALCLVLAVWFRCGSPALPEVKVHAVGIVDGKPIHMFTASYRADAGRQRVLWWVEGGPDSPMVLEKCTVTDALNWRCESSENQAGSVMVNGRYGTVGVVDPDGWKFLTESEWKALQAQQK